MKLNRIKLIAVIIAIALSVPFFGRNWNRLMHLLGGVLFLGDVIITAGWASFGRRSRDPEAIRFAVRGIMFTDALFLLPGVVLLFVNGGILGTPWFKVAAPWLLISLALFLITGILYGAVLERTQKKMLRLVDAMPHGGPVPPEFDALMAKWFRFGGIATLLALIVLVLMVYKPAF